MRGKGTRTYIQTLPQRAAFARAMIANGWKAGFNGDLYWRRGGAFTQALMDLPENQSLAAQYRGLQAQSRQDKEAYDINEMRERARRVRMGVAVGGHFAGMLGHSLQEAGYQRTGAAFNILGGTMGGAASGAMIGSRGGPWGVALGALIGAAASATSEISKMAKAAEEAAMKMNMLGRSEQGQWFEYQNDQRLTALQKMVEGQSELDPNKLEFYGAQVEKMQNQAKLEMDNTKSLYESFHKMAEDAYGNPNLSDENRKDLLDQSLNAYKEYQAAASRYGQWEELGKQVQKIRDMQDPYSNENHEKFVEEMNRQAEMERENEEKRKQLLMEREQILLGIEQEYAQQGVDILSGMGKSGKYMSQAEAASTSQERYAPITKKLDTMQKSLDHLSQIDSKLRNLNIGLT